VSHNIVVMMRSPRVDVDAVGKNMPKSGHMSEKHSRSLRVWSVVDLRVGLLVEEVHTKLLSYASWQRHRDIAVSGMKSLPSRAGVDDDIAESTLVVAWCHCRDLPAILCRVDVGRDAISLSRQLGCGGAETMLVMMRCICTCKPNKLMHGVTMHVTTTLCICMYL
jgi:hypothetical protein